MKTIFSMGEWSASIAFCVYRVWIYHRRASRESRFVWFLRVVFFFLLQFCFSAHSLPLHDYFSVISGKCMFRWDYWRNTTMSMFIVQSELAVAGEGIMHSANDHWSKQTDCAFRECSCFHTVWWLTVYYLASLRNFYGKHFAKDTRVHINHKLQVSKWIDRSLISNKNCKPRKNKIPSIVIAFHIRELNTFLFSWYSSGHIVAHPKLWSAHAIDILVRVVSENWFHNSYKIETIGRSVENVRVNSIREYSSQFN